MIFGPDNNLYVCHRQKISRYNGTTGSYIDDFVPINSGGIMYPIDLTFGPDGNLYVSDIDTDRVIRYNGISGEFIDTFASGGSLDHPFGLTFGIDGNLYVSSEGSNSVKRYDGITGAFIDDFVISGSGGLLMPTYNLFVIPEPATLLLLGLGGLLIKK
jgi:outer membrane protein assembly factor BamB